jgi:hypothetical protein
MEATEQARRGQANALLPLTVIRSATDAAEPQHGAY